MKIEEMDDALKSTMWCCGALDEMKEMGLIGGGEWELTVRGTSIFDQLEQCHKPSDEHIVGFSQVIGGEQAMEIAGLLSAYRDKKEEMIKEIAKYEEMGEQD